MAHELSMVLDFWILEGKSKAVIFCDIKIVWNFNFRVHGQIWLALSHVHSYTYCLHWSLTSRAELSHCDRDHLAHKAKNIYCEALYRERICCLSRCFQSILFSTPFFKSLLVFSSIFMTQSHITCASPKTHLRCTRILSHKDSFPNDLFMFPFLQFPVSFLPFFF